MRPGDIVHTEHYEAPPTGAPYAINVIVKRSGGYAVETRQLDGPGYGWFTRTDPDHGYKTIKGAVNGGQRTARAMEDQTYREGFDN